MIMHLMFSYSQTLFPSPPLPFAFCIPSPLPNNFENKIKKFKKNADSLFIVVVNKLLH